MEAVALRCTVLHAEHHLQIGTLQPNCWDLNSTSPGIIYLSSEMHICCFPQGKHDTIRPISLAYK